MMIGIAVVATILRLYDFPITPLTGICIRWTNGGKFRDGIDKRWFLVFFMG